MEDKLIHITGEDESRYRSHYFRILIRIYAVYRVRSVVIQVVFL